MSSIITSNPTDEIKIDFNEEEESSSWSDEEDEKQNETEGREKPLTQMDMIEMQQKALNSEWMLNTPMTKWSNEQLTAWAATLNATELEKKAMSKEFDGNNILQCKDHKQLMKQLNISEYEAKELLEEIAIQKKIEKQKKYSQKFGSQGQKVFSDASRWKEKAITKWTIEQTAEWIKSLRLKKRDEEEVVEKIIDLEFDSEIIINYLGEDVKSKMKMSKGKHNKSSTEKFDGIIELSKILDIKPSIATIICMAAEQRLRADMKKSKYKHFDDEKKEFKPLQQEFRDRTINTEKYKHIVLSNDKDIIMKYDNNDGILRAKMPGCGHAIAAETMYFYIKSVFEKHLSATDILCPDPKCRKPWDWSYCVVVADMNENERSYWNNERQERMASVNFRKCPHCGIMCDKPDDLGTLRVRCNSCNKNDWCWICRNEWTSSSKRICGNDDCKMVKDINDTLAKAKLFKPMGWGKKKLDVEIPEIRACPICMTIVHHIEENDEHGHHCKHVTCPVCKPRVEFCFICLGIRDQNTRKWPCGSYYDTCEPKSAQRFE